MYINGEVSKTDPVNLGVVPQGSILSPLLFNVYIGILSTAVAKSELIFYVDETVPWLLHRHLKNLMMPFDMTSTN